MLNSVGPDQGESLWQQIRDHLIKKNPNNLGLAAWLAPIGVEQLINKEHGLCLVLNAPSEIHRRHIIDHLMDTLYMEAQAIWPNLSIDVVVTKSPIFHPESISPESHQELPKESYQSPCMPSPAVRRIEYLDPNFTFSTFIVGRNSEFAHAACFNVARNPGLESYNPLLICGPVGMGKTHLLHAVGHEILSHSPHLKIVYLQAERFLNEFVAAMRNKRTDEFRIKYRDQVDVLLFDDIQFIGKGEATQEEFFHIFNSLIDKKKQIILASDRRPKDILKLEDRNRSRLEWGLTVDITMPDYETRLAILRFKAEQSHLRLSEEVMQYIARVAKRSIREIEGALKTLKMFAELQGVAIDLALAKRILVSQETNSNITPDDILRLVSEQFKVTVADLKSSSRAKPIVVPRQIAMYLIKKHLNKSFVEIGRFFGGRDHTTVMNAIDKVTYLHQNDLDIRNHIEDLTNQIHNITGV